MLIFGAAVEASTDDRLFMAGPSRTSEATAKVFVPSVRWPTSSNKKTARRRSILEGYRHQQDRSGGSEGSSATASVLEWQKAPSGR
jgi:hypothetical protein